MENIVAVLTQINEKAEKILSDANGYKLNMQKQMEVDLVEYEEQLNAKTEKELEAAANEHNLSFEQKKATIYEDTQAQINAMEDNYNKNHDTLVKDIFDKVITFEA